VAEQRDVERRRAAQQGGPPPADLDRQEMVAALEVRRELGPSYEQEVVDSFVERIEQTLAARVDARLADERSRRKQDDDRDSKQMALGITSMALGIPISAIAAGTADLPGLVVSWAGIVAVNAAYAWQHRPPRT
jgi:NCAIR mutase (PurE)-related protein